MAINNIHPSCGDPVVCVQYSGREVISLLARNTASAAAAVMTQ